jgi:SAM-dependent methyltransferase
MNNEEKIIIRPEYSAVAAKSPNPSRSAQAAISAFKEQGLSRIVEIGCGLLANTPHILKAFPFVILVDTKHQYTRIRDRFVQMSELYSSLEKFIDAESFQSKKMQLDGAIVINILHILPTIEARINVLRSAHQNLRKEGFLFLDVPWHEKYYRKQVRTAKPYNDGRIMKRGNYYTFYKNMSLLELTEYAESLDFSVRKRIDLDHRLTLVCQK